jgi:hypothetical protein
MEKLREVLTPGIEYHDVSTVRLCFLPRAIDLKHTMLTQWCRNAPDIGSEEDVYLQELEYAVANHYAAGEAELQHLHYYNNIHQSSPSCEDKSFDIDSELYFNAEFDD